MIWLSVYLWGMGALVALYHEIRLLGEPRIGMLIRSVIWPAYYPLFTITVFLSEI